jgi:hypothetical protein
MEKRLTLAEAFEIGFCWSRHLEGSAQTREDSRAVGRTLCSDLFDGLPINLDAVPSFASADEGIAAAKAEICRVLDTIEASRPSQG